MKRISPVCLAVLVLAALAAISGASGTAAQTTTRLVVIDQNLLHGMLNEDPVAEPFDRVGERIQLVGNALAAAQPEIVTMQEINITAADGYPDIRAALHTALPDYQQVFGSITGDPIGQGALGQMTLTKLPITSSENRHIQGVRAVHRVTFTTGAGPVDVYNVHLDGTDDNDPTFSVNELNIVFDFINQTKSGGPVIVAGDFNARPDSPSIKAMLDAGYVDALVKAGDSTCDRAGDPGCTNSNMPLGDNPNHNSDQRIDYIFVHSSASTDVSVSEASLFDNAPVDIGGGHTLWPSDHIGVRAVLELQPTGKLPSTGSGPQRHVSGPWWLVGALAAAAGVLLTSASLVLNRRQV